MHPARKPRNHQNETITKCWNSPQNPDCALSQNLIRTWTGDCKNQKPNQTSTINIWQIQTTLIHFSNLYLWHLSTYSYLQTMAHCSCSFYTIHFDRKLYLLQILRIYSSVPWNSCLSTRCCIYFKYWLILILTWCPFTIEMVKIKCL